MSANIQQLIEVWSVRPPRVEPDDNDHLTYIFTKLLPALVAAMPDIERLTSPKVVPVAGSLWPSNAPSLEPLPEPSSHTQVVIQNTDGIAVENDQTRDTGGSVSSLSANAVPPGVRRPEGAKHPRRGVTRKRADVPPATPPETESSETT